MARGLHNQETSGLLAVTLTWQAATTASWISRKIYQNSEGGMRHLMDSQMRKDLGFSVDPVQQAKDAAFKRQVLERAQAETHVEGQDSKNAPHAAGSQVIASLT